MKIKAEHNRTYEPLSTLDEDNLYMDVLEVIDRWVVEVSIHPAHVVSHMIAVLSDEAQFLADNTDERPTREWAAGVVATLDTLDTHTPRAIARRAALRTV